MASSFTFRFEPRLRLIRRACEWTRGTARRLLQSFLEAITVP